MTILHVDGFETYGQQAGKSVNLKMTGRQAAQHVLDAQQMHELKERAIRHIQHQEYVFCGLQCNWLPKEYRARRRVYLYTLPMDYEMFVG